MVLANKIGFVLLPFTDIIIIRVSVNTIVMARFIVFLFQKQY